MDTNTELMLKEQMKDFDLVLAGDRTVLEAAEVSERDVYKRQTMGFSFS